MLYLLFLALHTNEGIAFFSFSLRSDRLKCSAFLNFTASVKCLPRNQDDVSDELIARLKEFLLVVGV